MNMGNGKKSVGWVGMLLSVFLVFAVGTNAGAASAPTGSGEGRADVITIDALRAFGKLERLPVVFLHGKHTEAMEKKQKDCLACHLPDPEFKGKPVSPKFKRLKDEGRQAVMDIYHDNCIGCHQEIAEAGQKTGPIVCGECHGKEARYVSARLPMGFDLSLHYRHSKAADNKCESCHHAYDPATKALYYDKGKEGTCRYCHKDQKEENRISMPLASHLACIDCHRKMTAEKKKAGPVDCFGCHDADARQMIEKEKSVPRMERGQPDFALVRVSPKDASASQPGPQGRMNRVPFAHKAHEAYNDTCRVCHHAGLQPCADCHTVTGSKEAKGVKLEQAMHMLNATESCIGCHETMQRDQACSGCHAFQAKGIKAESGCISCHMAPFPGMRDPAGAPGETVISENLLQARVPVVDTYAEADIPDKVLIKTMAEKYEPVELPHRRIVNALLGKIKESKLVNHFHQDKGTICQGCHHNSPPSTKPPLCGSCHGKPLSEPNLAMPGLLAAYHRQCMGCHFEMGIEKPVSTDCTACHLLPLALKK
jgi:hypothetical protein